MDIKTLKIIVIKIIIGLLILRNASFCFDANKFCFINIV